MRHGAECCDSVNEHCEWVGGGEKGRVILEQLTEFLLPKKKIPFHKVNSIYF